MIHFNTDTQDDDFYSDIDELDMGVCDYSSERAGYTSQQDAGCQCEDYPCCGCD